MVSVVCCNVLWQLSTQGPLGCVWEEPDSCLAELNLYSSDGHQIFIPLFSLALSFSSCLCLIVSL